jgi:hypothetical protein
VADVYMIVGAMSATIGSGSGDWRRLVEIVLDGLRPGAAGRRSNE